MRDPRRVTEQVNTGSVPMPGDPRVAFYVDALGVLETTACRFWSAAPSLIRGTPGAIATPRISTSMLRREDVRLALSAFDDAGYHVDVPFPHWLGKVHRHDQYIDVVFSSGNGIVSVDDRWFTHAIPGEVLGIPVALCPAEELLWSSAFVQERERYDGAAVLHLLHAQALIFDWTRLLERFGRELAGAPQLPDPFSVRCTRIVEETCQNEVMHELTGPPPASAARARKSACASGRCSRESSTCSTSISSATLMHASGRTAP